MLYLIDRRREEVYFLFQSMFYLISDRDCNLQSRVGSNCQSEMARKELDLTSYSHRDSHLSPNCHIWLTWKREEVYFLFQYMFYLISDRDCNLQSIVGSNCQSEMARKELDLTSYSHLSLSCYIWLTGGEKKYTSYSNLCSIWYR